MNHPQNIITLNGKNYDAKTGKAIDIVVHHHTPAAQPSTKPQPISVKSTPQPPHHAHKSAQPAHKVHHHLQHSKTLMRIAVHKPKTAHLADVSTPVKAHHQPTHKAETASLWDSHDSKERLKRAYEVPKSAHISRFNFEFSKTASPFSLQTTHAPLSVKSAPEPFHPRKESPQTSPTNELFTNALHNATSHQQAAIKLPKRHHKVAKKLGMTARMANIGISVAAVLVLGGFFVYQNLPNLSMHVADAKAGINASLPGYTPSGFSMNHSIEANAGQIVISFHSNSDSRNFKLTQEASAWDSQTLREAYVASASPNPQVITSDTGKTIFLYNNSATWVDGGLWYRISGNSSLSSSQLIHIANSF